MTDAFAPYDLAGLPLANRIAMAPMTRCRAGEDGTVTPLMAEYYAQRASLGLIVTEGIQPSAEGQGYPWTPGLHTDAQARSWRGVTRAVHAAGGRIAAQLMHAGRVAHPSLHDGAAPVAPSAIRAEARVFTASGMQDTVTPRALDDSGIAQVIQDHVSAARRAIDRGFDAVELHAGNGYLLHQFLSPTSNVRSDRWGAAPTGRTRFVVALAAAVADAVGPARVALRVSPGGGASCGMHEPPELWEETYVPLARALGRLGLAYLHVVESAGPGLTPSLRRAFGGALMVNPCAGSDPDAAREALERISQGEMDVVSFGTLALANPDLPARLRGDGPWNPPARESFYGGGAVGYTDYPTLAEAPGGVAQSSPEPRRARPDRRG